MSARKIRVNALNTVEELVKDVEKNGSDKHLLVLIRGAFLTLYKVGALNADDFTGAVAALNEAEASWAKKMARKAKRQKAGASA